MAKQRKRMKVRNASPAFKAKQAAEDRVRNARPEKIAWKRDHNAERNHGITPDDRARLLEAQGGTCAIAGCGREPTDIDHHHKARGKGRNAAPHGREDVRGILCHKHNGHGGVAPIDVAVDALQAFGHTAEEICTYLLGAGYAVELVNYIYNPPAPRVLR